MKIIHVIPNIGESSFGGGQVALHLAKEQLCQGKESQIWSLGNETDRLWGAQFSGYPLERLHGFQASFPRAMRTSRHMEQVALRQASEISVLHQHALWTGLSRVACRLRTSAKTTVVISPHGALEGWALRKSRWKKQLALALYERENLRNASCLQACSEQEAAGFREYGLKNPIAVIGNGISDSWLQSSGDGQRFRKQFSLPAGKRILLYLSRIAPIKGVPLLIEALARSGKYLDEWTLVLAGGDEGGHLGEVRDLVARLHLERHVHFVGLLSGQEKRDAFAAAELFVLPTKREAAPVVVPEALGAGVPVITTKGAPWEALVTEGCGWWAEVSAEAIAGALQDAFGSEPDRLREMGKRGRELATANFSWQSSAQKSIELYEWLLGHRGKPEFVL